MAEGVGSVPFGLGCRGLPKKCSTTHEFSTTLDFGTSAPSLEAHVMFRCRFAECVQWLLGIFHVGASLVLAMVPTFCKPPVFIVTVRRLLPFVSSLADDHAIIPYLLISQGPKAQLYKDKLEGFNFVTPSCSELQWTALHCPTCRTMLLHLLRRKIVCAAKSCA